MPARRWMLGALGAVAAILVAGRAIAALYVEQAWFDALGLPMLGRANLLGELLLRGGTTLLATLFLLLNLYVVRRSVVSLVLPRRVGDLEFGEEVPGPYLVGVAAGIAIVVGSFLGIPGDAWPHFALALDGVRFGERDPYFERDLGFFVASLPAELLLFVAAQRLLIVTGALVIGLYALTPSIRWRARTLYVSEYVRRHLTVLGGILMLLFAWGFRLEGFQLLLEGSGVGGAFAAIDLQVRVPGTLVLAATALAAGVVVIWSGAAGQIRLAFLALSVLLLLAVIVRHVLPLALQPAGDAVLAEQPYLETREGFTRRAFGGDRVALLRADGADSALYVAGAEGVAVWDEAVLLRATDGAAAVGWLRVGAEVHAVVAQRGLTDGAEATPWTVSRMMGWAADAMGGPMVHRPARGESPDVLMPVISIDTAPAYRIVPDPGGLVLGASATRPVSRLAHAWALQNFRILLGRLPDADPTIVIRPHLRDRVAAAVPFFVQGSAAYPAVAGDTLFWIVDLYTASSTYPLSEPLVLAGASRRYFHPAGHALVNSATGLVRVAAVVDPEPPVRTWMARFPELFTDGDSLPEGLRDALVPLPQAARARALTFARLGPTALDAPPARRHLAVEHGADSIVARGLSPVALAGRAGLTLALPVLDERDHVAGIVVASGPSTVTRFIPSSEPLRSWGAVLDELRAADSTPARRDARAVRGRVRAVPVPGSIAYVQPTYLWPIRREPGLASVTVLTDSGVWSGRSMRGIAPGALPNATELEPNTAGARALYVRMQEALRRGDWQAFGAAFEMLGRALEMPERPKLPARPGVDSLRAP